MCADLRQSRFFLFGFTLTFGVWTCIRAAAGASTLSDQAVDTVPPQVTGAAPGSRDGVKGTNTAIQVTFSESMDPSTVTAENFRVAGVAGTVSYDDPSRTATFLPSQDLPPGTGYTVTVARWMTDTAGNPLSTDFTWWFKLEFYETPNTVAPTVKALFPASGDAPGGVNTAVQVCFWDLMDARTVNAGTMLVDGGIPGTVVYDASSRCATFYPAQDLAPSTGHTVTVTTGAADLAGNAVASDILRGFYTGAAADRTPPTVVGVYPENGVTLKGVWDRDSAVRVNFSEAMDVQSINESTFEINGVSHKPSYDAEARSLTVYGVSPNLNCTATLKAGVRDLAGNPLPADYTWQFTTGPAGTAAPITGSGSSNAPADVVGMGDLDLGGGDLSICFVTSLLR